MDRSARRPCAPASVTWPPSESWLFAQEMLGHPIPNPYAAALRAQAEREQLEWLAEISDAHAEQLGKLRSAEAAARRQRELLEWLATISDEHSAKLRRILREEADAREAQRRWEQYYERQFLEEAWDPAKHPRLGTSPNAG